MLDPLMVSKWTREILALFVAVEAQKPLVAAEIQV